MACRMSWVRTPDVSTKGTVAQLVELLLCKQDVKGSNPFGSI